MGKGIAVRMKRKKRIIGGVLLFCMLMGILAVIYKPKEKVPDNRSTLNLALSENKFYIKEEVYEDGMKAIVEPFLAQYRVEDYIQGKDGLQLHYEKFLNPNTKGTIVISHGFTEFSRKYDEIIYYFLKEGYSVFLMEHRGHGYSEREVEDLSMVSVGDFKDYVEDLKIFLDEIVVPDTKEQPLYLYAHSMGGAIGALFCETYPEYFDKAVLSSPMFEMNLGKYPRVVATVISKLACTFGKGEKYVFGHRAFTGRYNFKGSASVSEVRYKRCFAWKQENERYQTNGANFKWLNTNLKATKNILKKKNLKKLTIPILVFEAEEDTMVMVEGLYKFVNRVPTAQLVYVEGVKHEIFAAEDKILTAYMNTIFSFLEES